MERRISSGNRIRYKKQGSLLVSCKMYSNGRDLVRLILDTENMVYKIVDATTGFALEEGGDVTNLEVLQRKAKRHLKKYLDIHFEKEDRNAGRFKK